jgi:hypothetical protein
MIAVPNVEPVTIPDVEPIGAIPVLLLLHVPPPASVRVDIKPKHIAVTPVIGSGVRFTVSEVVTKHPVDKP